MDKKIMIDMLLCVTSQAKRVNALVTSMVGRC